MSGECTNVCFAICKLLQVDVVSNSFFFFTLFCHILLQGECTDHMMGGNLSSTVCADECEAFLMYLFGAGDSTCNMDIYKIKLLSTNVILQFSYHPVNFCLMWFQTDGN